MSTNKIVVLTLAALLLAVAAWQLYSWPGPQPAAIPAAPAAPESPALLSATGTVSSITASEAIIEREDGGPKTFAITAASRFSRMAPLRGAVSGSPVVVIYSKLLAKPVTALLSEPFMIDDASGNIELYSGSLVALVGRSVEISTDGGPMRFEFDRDNPLSEIETVNPADISAGDKISVRYTESEGEAVIESGFLE